MSFKTLRDEYVALARTDRVAAEALYWSNLKDGVVERMRDNSAEAVARAGSVDLLVSLGGSSPMTTILAFEALQPTELLVLNSRSVRAAYDRIAEHIIGGGLRPYHQLAALHLVDPTDPLELYGTLRQEIERRGAQRVVIDITGGKKVMSATAAMSAWMMDLSLAYVDSTWDGVLRRPIPGSERLILLPNPVALFGEVHLSEATELFDSGAWPEAHAKLTRLAEELPDPARPRFIRDLAHLYGAWCDLDLDAIRERLGPVRAALDSGTAPLHKYAAGRVSAQLAHLEALVSEVPGAMPLTLLVLARHYRERGRHDFAVLLYYRALEAMLTRRLEVRFPEFSSREPRYDTWGEDVGTLEERVRTLWESVTRKPWRGGLPEWVGYGHSAVLLAAVGDELLGDSSKARRKLLGNLLHLGNLRNSSVLAHGTKVVGARDARSFDVAALRLLCTGERLEGRSDSEERLAELAPVQLSERVSLASRGT